MKKYIIFLILLLCVINLSLFAQKQKEIKIVKFLTSAHTKNCKEKIEKTLAYEKGVIESELNTDNQVLTVRFKPNKTNSKNIETIINNLGHDAELLIEIDEIPINKIE
jgi:copper chaperone CopZ